MLYNLIEILVFLVLILLSVAYLTVAERKTLAYMQRRLGPNVVGYYGQLMPIADALKLLLKEIILVRESDKLLIIISPIIALCFALLSWSVIPLSPGIAIGDINYSILFLLVIGSLGVFGTLLVGWSSNSKFTLLASIRSTAQLISYELILTTNIIICIFLNNTLNINHFIDNQQSVWLFLPLIPIAICNYIASLAETSRPPFDNVEAESELVSGHMTELSASPFVLFYLTEYNNIIVMCFINVILFFGGYIFDILPINYIISLFNINNFYYIYYIEYLLYVLNISIKVIILVYGFIWVRASFPRLRYDLLVNLCWVILLPLLFGIILIIPNILYIFDSFDLYT
uniref:NADH-ubiquinone oxidoreductase chain 1 n=1 Tax=Wickerhamomyces mucosus TaxID=1378264 RepID=S5TGF0_9ASCO|nr:NADH dehydrogenase subunit 1 [Wickerhamomyces mucosus]AGS44512.1 NADH dehydrogenase subunit 1 [Wickerhamomyces mucosus]